MTPCAPASVSRRTAETDVAVTVALDGTGKAEISTGIGFLDHMLELLARHALFDLNVKVTGDLHVDQHHTAEDTGIALGQAFLQALGDKKGITRYADIHLPMDETLTRVAVDISGRPFLVFRTAFPTEKIGAFDTELVRRMVSGLCGQCGPDPACGDVVRREQPPYCGDAARRARRAGRRVRARPSRDPRPRPGERPSRARPRLRDRNHRGGAEGEAARTLTGIEIEPEYAVEAAKVLDHVIVGDAATVTLDGPFDALIAADILEHLPDPWTTFCARTRSSSNPVRDRHRQPPERRPLEHVRPPRPRHLAAQARGHLRRHPPPLVHPLVTLKTAAHAGRDPHPALCRDGDAGC